ncbi:MAG TPA: DUF2092 domain-containing protein, partial [Tepidisphaeraceae bacterium]
KRYISPDGHPPATRPGESLQSRIDLKLRSPDRIRIVSASAVTRKIWFDGQQAYIQEDEHPTRIWQPLLLTADRILWTAPAMAFVDLDAATVAHLFRSDARQWLGSCKNFGVMQEINEGGATYARVAFTDANSNTWELWIDKEHPARLARAIVSTGVAPELTARTEYRFNDWDVTTPLADATFQFTGGSTWGNAFFDPMPQLKAGDVAPEFVLDGLTKKAIPSSDWRGAPLVIAFWWVSNAESVEAIPALRDQTAAMNVPLLLINRGNHAKDVRALFGRRGWTGLDSLLDHDSLTYVAYGVPAAPFVFILDPDFRIVHAGPLRTSADRENFAKALAKVAVMHGRDTPTTAP